MKKTLLLLTLFCSSLFSAQNINFVNGSLKEFLLNSTIDYDNNNIITYPAIDSNNDDEISLQEALLVNRLNFAYSELTDLQDLQFFTNLKSITSYFANFSNFNLPTLTNLEELLLINVLVGTSPISSLNFSGNTSLKKLELSSTTTSLDFSNNLNLVNLAVYAPNLTSINLNNLENLKFLSYFGKMATIDVSDCINLLNITSVGGIPINNEVPEENKLTSINLSNLTKLIRVDLTGNNLTTLNLSNSPNIEVITVAYNDLTSLNLGDIKYVKYLNCDNNFLTSLDLGSLFNIQNISCINNQLTTLSTKNGIIEEFIDFSGNPNLESICSDPNEVVYMKNQCLLNGYDESIVSDCSTPSNRIAVAMYPNPVRDVIHLASDKAITKVEIYGVNSLKVMTDESGSDIIYLEKLESGIYFLKVYNGEEVTHMKFMKS